MNLKLPAAAVVAVSLCAAPALAHHSFAMFDQTKAVTLKGTVKELEWSNPHAWLRVEIVDATTGKPQQYAFEMGSVARSTFDGWTRNTVKPGDVVSVTMAPLRDGSRGGMYLGIDLPNGKHLGRTGPAVGKVTPRDANGNLVREAPQ
jgi:hypothetical protein